MYELAAAAAFYGTRTAKMENKAKQDALRVQRAALRKEERQLDQN